MASFKKVFLPAFFWLLTAGGAVNADGFIYVESWRRPPPRPPHPRPFVRPVPRPHFPLEVVKHKVEITIDDSVAKTRVDETFFNPNDRQLEGTYLFPLPPGASVSKFSMLIGGKEVQGEVLEKDKARSIYESIVRQSRDPGLLEYIERGLFRARVFPIPPRGNVEIRVDYDEQLTLTGGFGRYRYPLNTGKYSAGDYRNVLIDVTLRTREPLRAVNCISHPASVNRPSDREARIVFEANRLTADKDFLLDWNMSEDALAPLLLTQRTHEPEGFFFLTIAPRPEKPKSPPPKDLVAVMDTSGSMMGEKIDQARRALRHFVNALNDGDRFNIVDFSTEARRFRENLVVVDPETRKQALAYIDGFQARGGTNIEEALRMALEGLAPEGSDAKDTGDRLKMVVLITDGEPTVGITRPDDITRSIREKNAKQRRIFTFGVGVDLNAQLLERLVQDNRGSLDYVLPGENMEVKLSSFWDKIDFPVLTDIRLEFPNLSVQDIYPKPLPDLFRGETLSVVGRFREEGRHPVVLRGKFQGQERVFEYSLDFQPKAANDFIARLWATRKIGYLLEAMRLSGESKEVKDEVIRLSQQYGILTPYTSYLILEERGQYVSPRRPGGPPELAAAREALEELDRAAPEGERTRWGARRQSASRSFSAKGGADGVAGGLSLKKLKDEKFNYALKEAEEYLGEINRSGVRIQQVGSRAFYMRGERWFEGGLSEEDLKSARKIAYLSEEYFDLLQRHPGIGELLAVGEKVTFRWKGQTIAVE